MSTPENDKIPAQPTPQPASRTRRELVVEDVEADGADDVKGGGISFQADAYGGLLDSQPTSVGG